MPCYEVNTISIEFQAKHKNLLLEALKQLGYSVSQYSQDLLYVTSRNGRFVIDLNKQTADIPEGMQNDLNTLKRKYSEVALKEVAKRNKWIVRDDKQDATKFQVVKY